MRRFRYARLTSCIVQQPSKAARSLGSPTWYSTSAAAMVLKYVRGCTARVSKIHHAADKHAVQHVYAHECDGCSHHPPPGQPHAALAACASTPARGLYLSASTARYEAYKVTRRHHHDTLQQWLFLNRKVKSLYNQRKRPAKLAWTTTYRKMHRKVCVCDVMQHLPPCTSAGPRAAGCSQEAEEPEQADRACHRWCLARGYQQAPHGASRAAQGLSGGCSAVRAATCNAVVTCMYATSQ